MPLLSEGHQRSTRVYVLTYSIRFDIAPSPDVEEDTGPGTSYPLVSPGPHLKGQPGSPRLGTLEKEPALFRLTRRTKRR